jgi:type IV secretory pathway VirJ component
MQAVNKADKLAGDWDIGVLESLALLAKQCIYGVEDKRKYCPATEELLR